MSEPKRVGIIGVGLLGGAMASRLLAAGWRVTGFDVDPSRGEWLQSQGGDGVDSADALLQACRLTILSLPTSEIARQVIGDSMDSLQPGALIVDTTTGSPQQMESLEEQLAERGVGYLEASVGGSSKAMRSGEACVFLGGELKHIEAAESLLNALAPRRFHLGPVGAASRFKLVHNMLLGLNRAALAESLAFAEALGFDSEEAVRVLSQTPATSMALEAKGEKMATGDYLPQGRLSQHHKDVKLIRTLASEVGLATPLSDIHSQLLQRAEQLGRGGDDNSAIVEVYRSQLKESAE